MRLVQFLDRARRAHVGVVAEDGATLHVIGGAHRVYDMALEAIRRHVGLAQIAARVADQGTGELRRGHRRRPAAPAAGSRRCGALAGHRHGPVPSGQRRRPATPCTSSSAGRGRADRLHEDVQVGAGRRQARAGRDRRAAGVVLQRRRTLRGPHRSSRSSCRPTRSTAARRSEVVGLYIVADDGTPWRVGFALGNEYADHVMERQNYLYLAHSKLRQCSYGPELLLARYPPACKGTAQAAARKRSASGAMNGSRATTTWRIPSPTSSITISSTRTSVAPATSMCTSSARPPAASPRTSRRAGRCVRDRQSGIRPTAAQPARRATRGVRTGHRPRRSDTEPSARQSRRQSPRAPRSA